MLDLEELLLYSKQISLPDIDLDGQLKLKKATVLVVGVGGLGCALLPYLAASGVGKIGLIDDDMIELSNLARQILFQKSDVGKTKVTTAARRLCSFYPNVQFAPVCARLDLEKANTLFPSYDLILDATDNSASRYCIDDACALLKKPWVYAAVQQWQGHVALFLPGKTTYRSLFPEEAKQERNCSSQGVIGAFVGMVGMVQAAHAIQWILGQGKSKLLLIDGKDWTIRSFGL